MRAASVSRFSRAPSTHNAVIRPAPRRASPYKTSKPTEEILALTATTKRHPKAAPSSFNDRIVMINKKLLSFSELEYDSHIKSIDVKRNQISTFLGLPSLKELESLDISDNQIKNFSGFPSLPKLRAISLTNTPLTLNRNFRIALILLVGSSLRLINGERISASERRFAASYPSESVTLLHLGWDISGQPPPATEVPHIMAKLTSTTVSSSHRRSSSISRSASTSRSSSRMSTSSRRSLVTKKLSEAVSSRLTQQEEEKKKLRKRIERMNRN